MTRKKTQGPVEAAALMTVDEVAATLNIHRTTVYRQLIATGRLTVVKTGRKTQVPRAEVEAYSAGQTKKAS